MHVYMHMQPRPCIACYSLLSSHKEDPGVLQFLQDDYVDVWQVTADGMVDVRVAKSRFDALVPSPECTLLIRNVEQYVRRMENVTTVSSTAAEWFEEYVSIMMPAIGDTVMLQIFLLPA